MNAHGWGRTALVSLALPLALTLGACSDEPSGPAAEEFDPQAAAAAVDSVMASADGSDDVLTSLELAGATLYEEGANAAMLPATRSSWRLLPEIRASGEISTAAPIFPSNLLGKTFTYDVEADRYIVDEERTGAPENGVRFVYYAIDPVTRRPVEPLDELGYLELRDESGAASTRLAIEVVRVDGESETTLIDYFIDGSYTETESALTVDVTAEGYLSDGAARLNFDLNQSATFSESSETIGIEMDHLLGIDGTGVSLHFEAEGELAVGSEDPVTMTASMTITDGSDVAVFDAEVADGAIDGSLEHNGETVVLVSGSAENPSFTDADGGALTVAEVAALKSIWDSIEDLFDFVEAIFSPFAE